MALMAFLGSHPGTRPVAGHPLEHVPQVKQTSASSGEVAILRFFLFILMGSCKILSSLQIAIDQVFTQTRTVIIKIIPPIEKYYDDVKY